MSVDTLAVKIASKSAEQYREQIASAIALRKSGAISEAYNLNTINTFDRPSANCANMDIDPVWIAAELFRSLYVICIL